MFVCLLAVLEQVSVRFNKQMVIGLLIFNLYRICSLSFDNIEELIAVLVI